MSDDGQSTQKSSIPAGLVWAALLFGVAAIIGAVAMLLWVVNLTRLSQPTVAESTSPVPMATAAPAGTAGGAAAPTGAAAAASSPSPAASTVPGLVVEDWSSYADDAALRAAFTTNNGWTTNGITLTLLPGPASPRGPAGAAVAYDIQVAAPNDYVGFERDLAAAQDWRGYDQLALWLQTTDRGARQLVLQFQEQSGEVWRHRLALQAVPLEGPVVVPLDPAAWEWADWSVAGNKQLDLDAINHMGVFIGHAGPGAGELRLGTVALQRGQ